MVEVGEALMKPSVVVVEPLAEVIELVEDDFQIGIHDAERSLLASEVVVGGCTSEI